MTRNLHVETDPPDARIILDGKLIGSSPVDQKFEYFGTREIIAEKDGYLREVRLVPIEGAWYDAFPFDFFTEVLPFFPRNDQRIVSLKLRLAPRNLTKSPTDTETQADSEALLRKAEQLRNWSPINRGENSSKP